MASTKGEEGVCVGGGGGGGKRWVKKGRGLKKCSEWSMEKVGD